MASLKRKMIARARTGLVEDTQHSKKEQAGSLKDLPQEDYVGSLKEDQAGSLEDLPH